MIPKKLNAALGGFFGPSSRIEWDGENLFYLFNPTAHAGEPGTEKTLIKVNETDWKIFYDTIDKIGVWEWKKRYENPEILDGTSWIFEAEYSDKSFNSSGSNSFPKGFNKFLDAISKLTHGLAFNKIDYFELAKKVAEEAVESISPLFKKDFIDNCKNRLDEKIKINFQNDKWCDGLSNSNGIYLFWADFSKWDSGLVDFSDKWNQTSEAVSYYPKFNKKRSLVHKSNEQKILPFYLGKAEKSISSRVKQHVFIEGAKTTYALKLKAICEYQKEFTNIAFFISELPLPFSPKSYFLLNIVEAKLRDELNPIIGKQ